MAGATPDLSDGVFSLRVFKAHKGGFEEMLRLTQVFIMPFYEKMGVRYIGFWRQIEAPGHEVPSDHDLVHMLTRYQSIEHWQATRKPWAWGERDEAFVRMANAMFERESHVIEQQHFFFDGFLGPVPPRLERPSVSLSAEDFQAACRATAGLAGKAAAEYCACVEPRLPGGSWSQPYFLAWLKAGGESRPDLTPSATKAIHDTCDRQPDAQLP